MALLGLSLMGYLPHAAAETSTVQSNFGASVCGAGSTCSTTVAFPLPVTIGDVAVVAVLDEISSMPTAVTDSLSSQYALFTSSANATAIGADVSVYYAPLLATGSDSVTVTDASGASTALLVSIFEVSGTSSLLQTVTSTSTATVTSTATHTVTSTKTSTVTTPGPTTTATATSTATQTVTSTTTLPPVTSTATQTVTSTVTTPGPTTTTTQTVTGPTTTVTQTATQTMTATSTQVNTITTTQTATQTSTAVPPMLSIGSVDQNGNPISGYFALLYSGSGQQLSFGYTPKTFTGLVQGATYGVFLSGFGSCTFSHWKDTGTATDPRTFVANGALTLVGVYNCASSAAAPKAAGGVPVSVGAPLSLLTIMGALIVSSTLGTSFMTSRKKK